MAALGLSVLAGLGGFEVRTVAVAALAVAGATAYTVGVATMAGVLAVVAVARGRMLWKRSRQAYVRSGEGEAG
jgi:uncharacterized membrane protein